ncbi:hypothetical protein SDC9_88950 [bioreactor metagenome]|uniref:Uncharacterized protein n=1 Tax=bioreactor metagenome TaxID=1076179 RepID=A0A644ZN03_9ZZZZ
MAVPPRAAVSSVAGQAPVWWSDRGRGRQDSGTAAVRSTVRPRISALTSTDVVSLLGRSLIGTVGLLGPDILGPDTGEHPQLAEHEVERGGDQGADQRGPVEQGPEAVRVVEHIARQRDRGGRVDHQGLHDDIDHEGGQARGEEREEPAPPATVMAGPEGPHPVQLVVPGVRDEEGHGRVQMVEPDAPPRAEQVEQGHLVVGVDLLADDHHQQVDQHTGTADETELEELPDGVPVRGRERLLVGSGRAGCGGSGGHGGAGLSVDGGERSEVGAGWDRLSDGAWAAADNVGSGTMNGS